MRNKRGLVFRIMAVALIILAAATGDRGTTAMLCGAGMLGLTANKLDGSAGFLGDKKRNREVSYNEG